jgi:predicted nucleic acid-binding protein
MQGILPDSSIWIDYNNPRASSPQKEYLINLIENDYPIFICPPVFQEVLQGSKTEKELKSAKRSLTNCYRGRLHIYKAAEYGAEIYRTLRSKGITIRKPNDCLIAAYCILNDLALLHHDRDFDPIEKHCGLVIVR